MRLLVSWIFFMLSVGIPILHATQIPSGQDVGTTVRMERTEKEQKALMKKLSQKKKKVEIEGQEALQPKPPARNS